MTEHTNLTDHHIEGYTPSSEYIKIHLITEVMPNLWVGGCVDRCRLPHDFKYVLSLYKWENYLLGPETERRVVAMNDSDETPDRDQIDELAHWVNNKRKLGKTLVHCQAGLNRSNLVMARALILSGYEPDLAIELLREKRGPFVLCNKVFEYWLRNTEPQ